MTRVFLKFWLLKKENNPFATCFKVIVNLFNLSSYEMNSKQTLLQDKGLCVGKDAAAYFEYFPASTSLLKVTERYVLTKP